MPPARRSGFRKPAAAWLGGLLGLALAAQSLDSLAAQSLDPLALQADGAASQQAADPLGLRVELSQQWFQLRHPPAAAVPAQQQGLVLDLRREWSLGSRTRVGLSNRAERLWSSARTQTRNALREAYVSHQWANGWFIDAGRINWRHGVASGFNPSDFLRDGAGIAQATQDPRALRENRLGTVMLRQQWLGEAGSIQAALIPAIAHGNDSPRGFGWRRTNARAALLLKLAPNLSERSTFDAIAYWRQGDAPRWGANLTYLASDAWVLHAEIAYAQRGTLPTALRPPTWRSADAQRWGLDHALGATWASASGPVWTIELQRDARQQSRAAFVRMAWDKPLGWPGTQLAAFVRQDLDHARRWWQLDLDWHLSGRHSLSLLLGGTAGRSARLAHAGGARHRAALAWRVSL
ncbi:hypothetical protein [Vandammella animalimorsus]|uniref:hypothetical protein n=1 Tax=Vandammella animalimorsus TaxID=2029117 RepID=UPI0011777EDC|nr:hypothetical protein [Vandammella animalimorsus]